MNEEDLLGWCFLGLSPNLCRKNAFYTHGEYDTVASAGPIISSASSVCFYGGGSVDHNQETEVQGGKSQQEYVVFQQLNTWGVYIKSRFWSILKKHYKDLAVPIQFFFHIAVISWRWATVFQVKQGCVHQCPQGPLHPPGLRALAEC